jgi:hypothetical protein
MEVEEAVEKVVDLGVKRREKISEIHEVMSEMDKLFELLSEIAPSTLDNQHDYIFGDDDD